MASDSAEERVLQALRSQPLRPRELVDQLREIPESIVRSAFWRLLDSGKISLTEDRKLRVVQEV